MAFLLNLSLAEHILKSVVELGICMLCNCILLCVNYLSYTINRLFLHVVSVIVRCIWNGGLSCDM